MVKMRPSGVQREQLNLIFSNNFFNSRFQSTRVKNFNDHFIFTDHFYELLFVPCISIFLLYTSPNNLFGQIFSSCWTRKTSHRDITYVTFRWSSVHNVALINLIHTFILYPVFLYIISIETALRTFSRTWFS